MKNTKFCKIREKILKMRQSPENQWSYEIGKERQRMAIFALQKLKDDEKIYNFWPTSEDSFQDIMKGIDFYISYFNGARIRVCSFSVTGEKWAEEDRKRHPEIPVVIIKLSDTSECIKGKIMEVVNHNK